MATAPALHSPEFLAQAESTPTEAIAEVHTRHEYLFLRKNDSGAYEIADWLIPRLERTVQGRDQLMLARLLISIGKLASANCTVACGEAQFATKQCLKKGADGKYHMISVVSVFCHKPWCMRCSAPEERLDYFLYRTGDNVAHASRATVAACEEHKLSPVIVRLSLYMDYPSATTFDDLRTRQETMQGHLDRWRDRLAAQFSLPKGVMGIFAADAITASRAGVRINYTGPDIPYRVMRDTWAQVAGPNARLHDHRRRDITLHEIDEDFKQFETLIEAELQCALDGWRWVRLCGVRERAAMQAAFEGYHLIRRLGSYHGFKKSEDTEEHDLDVCESETELVASLPAMERDLGCCIVCHDPLAIPIVGRYNTSLHFSEIATHIMQGHRTERKPDMHLKIQSCEEGRFERYEKRERWRRYSEYQPPS